MVMTATLYNKQKKNLSANKLPRSGPIRHDDMISISLIVLFRMNLP